MLLYLTPGGKFMLLILPPGEKIIIPDQVFGRIAYAPLFDPGGKFMLLILPPGGKLILQDHVFGRMAGSLLHKMSRAGSSLYKIRCPNGRPTQTTQQPSQHIGVF